jgi:phenylalanyl-tRNA synthetase beta chain
VKVTLSWLKEFLSPENIDPEEVKDLLTMSGTEVKKVEYTGAKYNNIVTGRILMFEPHPDADKLTVCKVDVGSEVLNIVCGAKNFKANDKVAVAVVGAVTAQGNSIARSKLRGIVSEGMMCSEYELGLSESSEGIMILDENTQIGESFARVMGLDDVVFELEITPNRPDCLSVAGIAREISALLKIPFKPFKYDFEKEININKDFEIEIKDYALCSRYSAKVFTGINNTLTPEWMKNRLILCDYRPVSLLVDLTNYVMHETGQPLHAFDKDLLYSDKIIVRPSEKGETIRSIDDNLRNLEEGMLVIADGQKPVAIAGVMGGKDTEINDATVNVLLESANFFGPSIMKTSAQLGLRSEASNRFEKKLDPHLTIIAIKRFEELLLSISGIKADTAIFDNYKEAKRSRQIELRLDRVKNVLGKEIPAREICDILSLLGLDNRLIIADNTITVEVPSMRFEDLEREIDLIEEIARVYGFNRFESKPPFSYIHRGKYTSAQKTMKKLADALCNVGLNEVINYTFVSEEWIKRLRLDVEDDFRNAVRILNPINEDFAYIRTSALPLLVKNVLNNINHGIKDIAIFEITKVFRDTGAGRLPEEKTVLGVMLSGRETLKGWDSIEKSYDYYSLKKILEHIFNIFYKDSSLSFEQKEYGFFHPVISTDVLINKVKMGIAGKIHPSIVDSLDILQDIFYMELNLDSFISKTKYSKDFSAIPAFPSIEIDIAVVADEDIAGFDVENEIRKTGTRILKGVRLFDIYRGKQVQEGKKSMAYSLTFQDDTRTLKDTEVEIIKKRILESLALRFGASLRE